MFSVKSFYSEFTSAAPRKKLLSSPLQGPEPTFKDTKFTLIQWMVVHEWLFHKRTSFLLLCFHLSLPDEHGTKKKSWDPDRIEVYDLLNTSGCSLSSDWDTESLVVARFIFENCPTQDEQCWSRSSVLYGDPKTKKKNGQFELRTVIPKLTFNFAFLLLRTGITCIPSQVQFHCYC